MDRKKLIGMFCFIALSISSSVAIETMYMERKPNSMAARTEEEFCKKFEEMIYSITSMESVRGCGLENFSCKEAINNCLGREEKCVNYGKNLAERSIKACREHFSYNSDLIHTMERFPSLESKIANKLVE